VVKTQFGIKDLENLSNVKAHTIRIWEKRYNLLEPERTDTNIRKYSLDSLKKLLNISYLYHAGHKISSLATYNQQQIQTLIKENLENNSLDYALNLFKSAMLEFDGNLFDQTLEKLLEEKTLRQIFSGIFVPLLTDVGVLWHSGTIDPSHEHFISEKIKHSIIEHLHKQKTIKNDSSKLFTLYLPLDEIHEIGLLYANYELLSAGFSTIYLGPNIPLESLNHVLKTKKENIFITYFTVQPGKDGIAEYFQKFSEMVCEKNKCELWVLGQKKEKTSNKNIKVFHSLKTFTAHIDSLKTA